MGTARLRAEAAQESAAPRARPRGLGPTLTLGWHRVLAPPGSPAPLRSGVGCRSAATWGPPQGRASGPLAEPGQETLTRAAGSGAEGGLWPAGWGGPALTVSVAAPVVHPPAPRGHGAHSPASGYSLCQLCVWPPEGQEPRRRALPGYVGAAGPAGNGPGRVGPSGCGQFVSQLQGLGAWAPQSHAVPLQFLRCHHGTGLGQDGQSEPPPGCARPPGREAERASGPSAPVEGVPRSSGPSCSLTPPPSLGSRGLAICPASDTCPHLCLRRNSFG